MARTVCPDCGHNVSDWAPTCIRCGYPLDANATTISSHFQTTITPVVAVPPLRHVEAPEASQVTALPLFPVTTRKLIVLSICTLGIYELYWCYHNWKRIKRSSGEDLSPFWRAFFAPLWGFSLFKKIRTVATEAGVSVNWNSDSVAIAYLVLAMTCRLPDPWWLISFATLLPLILVQQTAQRLNERYITPNSEALDDKYSTANIVTIVIGGLLFVLALIGAFLPE